MPSFCLRAGMWIAVLFYGVLLAEETLPATSPTPPVPAESKPTAGEPKPAAESPAPSNPDSPKTEPPAAETPKSDTPPAQATATAQAPIKFTNDPDAPPPVDILAAAKGGDLEAVKQFVERDPATLKQQNRLSDTALHWAASCGHADIVKYLLSKGADPNIKNIAGATPLHLAARRAYVDCMSALLHSKADPNIKNFLEDGEETPLHIAVQKGNVEAIELLLKNGADVNARMTDGTRPLDIAEKRPTGDVRRLLVKYKAQSNATEEE